jgi:ABC-type transport system involved in cytochrome c biogenesis permease subunit
MAIKFTFQGLLIYLALAGYLSAFLTSAASRKKAGQAVYLAGFIITAAAFAYRWYYVGHIPFQNMFEVFLSMGMFIYPISIFSRRLFGVGGETIDMLIGAVLLCPAGFVFNAGPQMLPPALQNWLFLPHVAAYLIAYVIIAKAATQAFCRIITKQNFPDVDDYENSTYKMISMGFPLLTLGLIFGRLGPKGIMVVRLVADLCAVFSFPLHLRQKIRPRKQRPGIGRDGGNYYNAAVGKPFPPFPRSA